jgi:2-keto-3-deoxy-L-rhamnonate aldolase RhmA
MLRTNAVKAKIKRGEVPIGALLLMPDPMVAELCALCGFDYVVFDGEHGAFEPSRLEHLVRACDSVGLTAIARLRVDSADAMLPYLETGILGVMQPHTRSASDAQWLVDGAKYAPIGKRGMGTGRVNAYGTIPGLEHVRQWNDEMLTIAQIEDREGIDNLPEILKVKGLDALYIGSNDLAQALGHTGEPNHPEVRKTQADLAQRVKAGGKWVGFGARHPYNAEEGRRLRGIGADLFSFNVVGLFLKTGTDLVNDTRALLRR